MERTDPRQLIAEAMRGTEIQTKSAWNDLDALATSVQIEQIEVDPEGIIVESDGSFRGSYNVYLSLHYGQGDDEFEVGDSFLGSFDGNLVNGLPVINDATVDTSRFYS